MLNHRISIEKKEYNKNRRKGQLEISNFQLFKKI